MAEEQGDAGEKTEAPTPRRSGQARSDGMVGQSADLSNVIGMIGAFIALHHIAPSLWSDMMLLVKGGLSSRFAQQELSAELVRDQFINLILLLLPEMLLLLLIAAACGAGCTLVQTRFLWSSKLFKPKFMHINPLAGIKRIFSAGNWINLGKSIAKLCIIGPIGYFAFFDFFPTFMSLMDVPIHQYLAITAHAATEIFKEIMMWLLVLAIADLIWQKYRTTKKLKMSRHEVKDERKATEGDETMRRRILAMGLQRARQRMMQSVPKADVVVTNPTHIAVALQYTGEPGKAPIVLAKGRGFIAERIKAIARENRVPVIERKPLARALFASVEVGGEIPYDLFKAVAELLAYVYRIRGRVPSKAKDAMQNRASRGSV